MSASSNNIRTHCVLRAYYLGKSGIFYVHITVEFVSIYDTSRYLASLMLLLCFCNHLGDGF